MSEKRMPEKKVKVGRVSISLWKSKRLMPGDEKSAGYVEKYVEFERVCIQHSRFDRKANAWSNQQIWMNIDELRDLSQALDEIGEEQSSPSSQESSIRLPRHTQRMPRRTPRSHPCPNCRSRLETSETRQT